MNKAVDGITGEIGDLDGVVGSVIGVGEQDALARLEGMTWVEAEKECFVGGISGIEPGRIRTLSEGGSAWLAVDKEFEILSRKGGGEIAAVDFLVKAEFESFSVREELKVAQSRSDVVDGPTTTSGVIRRMVLLLVIILGVILYFVLKS